MAKDPAFLFYANDFDVKTKFFTHEEVGVYIRLLIAQFQFGHLTEDQVHHIAGKTYENVMSKFKKDGSELYFNDRLDIEIQKRQSYSESRRKNVSVRYVGSHEATHVATHENGMKLHMENENEDVNTDTNTEEVKIKKGGTGGKKRKVFVAPSVQDVESFFVEKGFHSELGRKAFDYYDTAGWKDSHGKPVLNWKQKMIAVWMKDENRVSDGGNGMLSKAGQQSLKNAKSWIEKKMAEENSEPK